MTEDKKSPGNFDGIELYQPRRMALLDLWQLGAWRFKLYGIRANTPASDADGFDPALISAARAYLEVKLADMSATPHYGLGFVILHEWDSAEKWLLIQWWTDGCILRQILAGALEPGSHLFAPVSPDLMACAYELVPIDFERRAWVETVLSGQPAETYLQRSLPAGLY